MNALTNVYALGESIAHAYHRLLIGGIQIYIDLDYTPPSVTSGGAG